VSSSSLRILTATYRLQFNRHFTFAQAREIVPYLRALGINDYYALSLPSAIRDDIASDASGLRKYSRKIRKIHRLAGARAKWDQRGRTFRLGSPLTRARHEPRACRARRPRLQSGNDLDGA
jgi:hypothetical protein